MTRRLGTLLAAGILVVSAVPTAVADELRVVTVGFEYYPGDDDVPVELVVEEGDTLLYTNLDLFEHTLTHDPEAGGDKLFDTPVLGLAESAAVEGVAQLPPGAYAFFCVLHPNMAGVLVVTEGGS